MTNYSLDEPEAQAELAKIRQDCADLIDEKRRNLKASEDKAQSIASQLGSLSNAIAAKQALLAKPKPMPDDFASWPAWKAALKGWTLERKGGLEAEIAELEAQYRSLAKSLNGAQDDLDGAKVELVRAELGSAQLEREIARKRLADWDEKEGAARQLVLQVQHAVAVARQRRQAA